MKTSILFLANFFLFLFILSCSNETESDLTNNSLNPNLTYEKFDVSYGSHERQKLDIFLPKNRDSKTKVLILIHGGGWSSGNKEDMTSLKTLIAEDINNTAIINMNYRLANNNTKPFPMQMEDITSVVNFIKNNKSTYTISDEIGFIGISAGGHLALLWSYAFNLDSKVNMVCSLVGPTNFIDPIYLNNTNPEIQNFIDIFGTDLSTDYLKEISPLHQVTAASPPTILFYGGKDPLIPTSQGKDLRDKLQTLNITYDFTLYPDLGHGWTGVEFLDTWTKLKAFIHSEL